MSDFAELARRALRDSGYSLRAAARALNYDPAYVSRVLSGKQRPSPQFVEALNALVGRPVLPGPREAPAEPGVDGDLAHMRATVAYVLDHDNRHGATGRRDAARAAFLEAHMLACHAGDRPQEWFVLDMLAMHALEDGRTGEALVIADELLSRLRLPPRVALMARVRKARALAATGDRCRCMAELGAAWAALSESVGPRDPSWTWWINELEIAGHEGEALLTLGDAPAAVPRLRRAHELSQAFRADGRGTLYYTVSLLTAYARAGDWAECEATLLAFPGLLDAVGSGRNRRRLRTTLREIVRDPHAPTGLTGLTRDVARLPQLAAS
ncbi:hypothetical protein GCM10010218_54590 [Streptomyces mashuensis]|uniref:HTH cro/C1-type domain-containing protein n=1 Tax=Streptomyces mashuensis TaxID=33904 RepID=A0A919B838_9ACTN|nr:helix-turn-helix transcriptional regulator [Streptomyces mashuensis]GHF66178.1 hypothetical protein GCM10010218_54590 [Streptomyces mashuensis]